MTCDYGQCTRKEQKETIEYDGKHYHKECLRDRLTIRRILRLFEDNLGVDYVERVSKELVNLIYRDLHEPAYVEFVARDMFRRGKDNWGINSLRARVLWESLKKEYEGIKLVKDFEKLKFTSEKEKPLWEYERKPLSLPKAKRWCDE